MANQELKKGMIIIYTLLGIVFIAYVIISMLNGSENFDEVVFPIYFTTILSSAYFKKNILENTFVKYPFVIMTMLFLIFLVRTYLI